MRTEPAPAPLAAETSGAGGQKIVLAHGFAQNQDCWGPFAVALAQSFRVMRVDLPGHGASGSVSASVERGARLLGETGGSAHYVGYSMGGRHVLQLALDQPGLVQSATLIGAHPGLDDRTERDERRAWDLKMAQRLEDVGLEPFLDEWLELPLFRRLDPEARHLEARLRNGVSGLAASLRLAGTGSQESLWPRLSGLATPTLFLAGTRDPRYVAIAARAAHASPDFARARTVPEAGHAAHLERPGAVAELVTAWIPEAMSIVGSGSES